MPVLRYTTASVDFYLRFNREMKLSTWASNALDSTIVCQSQAVAAGLRNFPGLFFFLGGG